MLSSAPATTIPRLLLSVGLLHVVATIGAFVCCVTEAVRRLMCGWGGVRGSELIRATHTDQLDSGEEGLCNQAAVRPFRVPFELGLLFAIIIILPNNLAPERNKVTGGAFKKTIGTPHLGGELGAFCHSSEAAAQGGVLIGYG